MTSEFIPLLRPSAVARRAGISVIALASFAKPERIDGGLAHLRSLGFTPQLGTHTL